MYCERWSNEAATVHADITADHRDVPVTYLLFSYQFSAMGRGYNARTTMPFPNNLFSTCAGGNDLVQMEMLHLAVALKYFPRDPSRICSSTFSCQV